MKGKTLALFLCMMLVLSTTLVGCGNSKADKPADTKEEVATVEETEPEEVEEVTEPDPEPEPPNPYRDIYDKYVADGSFSDFTDFGIEAKAEDVRKGDGNAYISFIYNGWYITVTTANAKASESFIGIGSPSDLNNDKVFVKRVYRAPNSGNTVSCLENGGVIDLAVLDLLPDVINYCVNNPYSETASPVDGYEWVNYADIYDDFWS